MEMNSFFFQFVIKYVNTENDAMHKLQTKLADIYLVKCCLWIPNTGLSTQVTIELTDKHVQLTDCNTHISSEV